ncbi:MAG: SixA phosphatase family protein, partial [Geminicoccaceae bacterium]
MRHVMLLRHAKSSWDRTDLDDFDRPLSPRGRAAAPVIGRHVSHEGFWPDLVLCSPAERARQTWELVSAEWDQADKPRPPRLEVRSSLYMAMPAELLSTLSNVADEIMSVMVIGHNPGLGQFANRLVRNGQPQLRTIMAKKFPTAALAV